MKEQELKELDKLKKKCIDKRNGLPKKSAKTKDLERLQELLKKQEAEQETELDKAPTEDESVEKEKKTALKPLNNTEKAELKILEQRARTGNIVNSPSPVEMIRLGKLRKRAKING